MSNYDFRCEKCERIFEISCRFEDLKRELPCECGGTAIMGWWTGKSPGLSGVQEPGMRGVKRTFTPGLDIQSGRYFETRTEQEAYAKQKGLVGLGPEEYKRTRDSTPEPAPDWSGLKDAMKDAYDEVAAGKGPRHVVTSEIGSNIIGGN